jgi:glycosyltransferase involved in cell wall biosynthesis
VIQGIDPTIFHPAPRTGMFGDRFVVFSGGKLEYRKGQDIVVAAFRRFRERHPEALLVTAWHNHWPQLIADLDLAGHVRGVPRLTNGVLQIGEWLAANGIPQAAAVDVGCVPNAFMGQVVREADVALFPNRCEGGTNLVAMECMAAGVPTIVSSNTGHLDLLATGGCFALRAQRDTRRPTRHFAGVDGWGESDVDEIVELLEKLYADRDFAGQRATVGATVMARLTWQSQISALLRALDY